MLIPDSPLIDDSGRLEHSARSFFGVLVGLVVLDVILLFCLLNPFTRLNAQSRRYPLVDRAAMATVDDNALPPAKPSPLGDDAAASERAPSSIIPAPALIEVNK